MSFWDRLADRLRGIDTAAAPQNVVISALGRDSEQWSDFVNVLAGLQTPTEHTALRLAAVHACVNLIAGTISATTVDLLDVDSEGHASKQKRDALWYILNQEFTPRWNAAAGWEFLVLSLLIHGDAFARILRGPGGRVIGLEPLHPFRVDVTVTADRQRLVYRIGTDPQVFGDNAITILDQDDMLHIPGFGFDGRRGMSPLRYALSQAGAVALSAQDYAAQFFANSAVPQGLLTTDQVISPEKASDIRQSWAELYSGAANRGKIGVLGSGAKFHTLTMTSEDAQLLETRRFQVEEIARIYGVPPFMIGANDKTTSFGAGLEAMGTGFVRYTLRQHIKKFEAELTRKLLRRPALAARFDTSELTRASMREMAEAMRIGVGRAGEPGFFTANEARNGFDLNPLEGGNSLYSGAPAAPAGAMASGVTNAA